MRLFSLFIYFIFTLLHALVWAQEQNVLINSQFRYSSLLQSKMVATDSIDHKVTPLPLYFAQFNHSKIPFPVYNGSLSDAKGYSCYLNAGFYLRHESLILQLAPEFTTYTQPSYEGFSQKNSSILWSKRYAWWNQIDVPENTYDSLMGYHLGQSFIGLDMEKVILKLSTENRWWGPGKYNALVLSANGSGFPHISLSSDEPLSIGIATLEFQSITGLLSNSGLFPPDTSFIDRGNKLYVAKPETKRMLSGISLSIHPEIFPGLTVGINNVTQQYIDQVETNDYMSGLTSLFLKSEGYYDNVPKQQLRSWFINWQSRDSSFTIYGERIKQNPKLSFFDAQNYPDRGTGFLFGLEKHFPTRHNHQWVFTTEITKMSQNPIYAIEDGTSIYLDQKIRQGYTHKGELLGSALGPGGNQQLFSLQFVTRKRIIGLEFQRYVRDLDFYYFAFSENRDFRRYWVDIGTALFYQHDFENMLINLSARHIYAINYQWEHPQDPDDLYFAPGRDLNNWQLQCQLLIPIQL